MQIGDTPFEPPNVDQLNVGTVAGGQELHGSAPTRAGRVLREHHDELMGRKGVTMIGESQDAMGRPAIIIGVEKPQNLSGLPREIDGVPVITQVTGIIQAQ